MNEAEFMSWEEMFSAPCSGELSQPVVSVPISVFNEERDAIVTAARRNGFMRVLFMKDPANAHFCRYV